MLNRIRIVTRTLEGTAVCICIRQVAEQLLSLYIAKLNP